MIFPSVLFHEFRLRSSLGCDCCFFDDDSSYRVMFYVCLLLTYLFCVYTLKIHGDCMKI